MTLIKFPDRKGQVDAEKAKLDSDMKKLGETIQRHGTTYRKWRLYRGLTMQRAAMALNVPHSALSRIESGDRQPRLEFLQKMARAYDCTIDALLKDPPSETGVA